MCEKTFLPRCLAVLLSLVLLCAAMPVMAFAEDTYDPIISVSVSGTENYKKAFEVAELVNDERAKAGASPLTPDKGLMEAAMLRASELAVYYSHTRPNGERGIGIIRGMYDSAGHVGENIAMNYISTDEYDFTAQEVMDAWVNSAGHYANIIEGDYGHIGVGCFEVENCRGTLTCWVQLFSENAGENAAGTDNGTFVTRGIETRTSMLFAELSVEEKTSSPLFELVNKGFSMVKLIVPTTDFTVASGNEKVASVSDTGKITVKKAGTVTFTAKLKSAPGISALVKFTAKKPEKVTYLKYYWGYENTLNIYWGGSYTAGGYQLQRCKNGKWVTVQTGEMSEYQSKAGKLSPDKTYKYRVRPYKMYGNKKIYGAFVKITVKPGQ